MFSNLGSKCFSKDPQRWILIAAAFALMVLSPAPFCSASGSIPPKQETPSITLTKAQNDQQIAVAVGTVVVVELPFLGSAGYGWHIETPDHNALQFLREETKPIDTTGKIGGPVLGRWHFRAVKEGMTSIRMSYYRAWEGPSTAVDRFAVEIKVERETK